MIEELNTPKNWHNIAAYGKENDIEISEVFYGWIT